MTRINRADELFRRTKELSLNDKFLRFFRKNLTDYVKANPLPPPKKEFFLKKVFSLSALPATAVIILFIFSGGLIGVLAAAGSVPGDLLYPVKITSEELRAVFIPAGKPKADFRLKQAYTRINEIKELEKKTIQNTVRLEEKNNSLVKKTSRQFNSHLADALKQARLLKKENKLEEAAAANEKLAVSLKFYEKILEKEPADSAEDEADENRGIPEIKMIIKATKDFAAEAALEQAEVKKQAAGDVSSESEAEKKITAAASQIKEVEALIKAGEMPPSIMSKTENELEKARSSLSQAREKSDKKDLSGAFAKAQDSLEMTGKIRALMETAIMVEREKPDEAPAQIRDMLIAEEESRIDNQDKGQAENKIKEEEPARPLEAEENSQQGKNGWLSGEKREEDENREENRGQN